VDRAHNSATDGQPEFPQQGGMQRTGQTQPLNCTWAYSRNVLKIRMSVVQVFQTRITHNFSNNF